MKRFTFVLSFTALLLAGFTAASFAATAEPSRLITQETGDILADGEVIADLGVADGTGFYTSQFPYQGYVPTLLVDMGIWKGELSIGAGYGPIGGGLSVGTEATAQSGSIGYKMRVGPGAAYGRLNLNQVSESPTGGGATIKTSDFNVLVGYALTKPLQKGKMNFNGEIILNSGSAPVGGVDTSASNAIIRLNGGVLMPVIPKLAVVGELGIDLSNSNPQMTSGGTSASDIVIGGGLRLTPNNRVTIDGMVLSVNNMSGNGRVFDSLTAIGTPVMIRAAFAF